MSWSSEDYIKQISMEVVDKVLEAHRKGLKDGALLLKDYLSKNLTKIDIIEEIHIKEINLLIELFFHAFQKAENELKT
jgi:hypothetical protein